MAVSLKPVNEQVIVITGASSGIGLATALAAAAQGAKLVLASRNDEALAGIEELIRRQGVEAIHVPADVGVRADVEKVANAAIGRFGGFDTWVNNAGVSIYGKLADIPEADARRLFDTNFWGVVSGSLVAVDHLRARGGALINVGSEVSETAIPLQGIYVASKQAVKGFTDALRIELAEEDAPVSVTLIRPTAIDTPFAQHARNYLDREPKLPDPLWPPEEVARAILHAAAHPERDIFVGGQSKITSVLSHALPQAADRFGETMVEKQQRDIPAQDRPDNLYEPSEPTQVHGDQPGIRLRRSLYTRAAMHPVLTGALLGAVGLGVALALQPRQ